MGNKIFSCILTLALLLALAVPASAYDAGETGRVNTLSIGTYHVGAIDTNGSLWMWGANCYGQVGNGGTGDGGDLIVGNATTNYGFVCQTRPVRVLDDVAAVSAGGVSSAAIKTDGTLWSWGDNHRGQVGNGGKGNAKNNQDQSICQTAPVKIMDDVAQISEGGYHAAAIKEDGSLWSWGYNALGQVGNGGKGNAKTTEGFICQSTPVKVMDGVAAVSAGLWHTAAIKTDGTLWVWGYNRLGAVGSGSGLVVNEPVKVMDDVAAVCAGADFTAAIKTDGSLWIWGSNEYGQLGNSGKGDAKTTDGIVYQTTPVKLMDDAASVNAGESSTAVIKTDGSLFMWGKGMYIGDRALDGEDARNAPKLQEQIYSVPNKMGDNMVAVRTNSDISAVINSDGLLQMWGYNNRGSLGNGTMDATSNRVTFNALTVRLPVFTDVPSSSWCIDGVTWALMQGITSGTSYTTFSPGETCTTAQVLAFLWRANGSPEPRTTNPYTDVENNAWYTKAAIWAYEEGLVTGSALNPKAPCTRSSVVTYLWKLAGEPASVSAAGFSDVAPDAAYRNAVSWAVANGITSGTSATEFSPDLSCTRGQVVVFLHRAMKG